MSAAAVHLSVVSHGHGPLVHSLLRDLEAEGAAVDLRVTVTLNVGEDLPFAPSTLSLPVSIVRNAAPRGFGANHNAAFRAGRDAAYFGVLNPDVRVPAGAIGRLVGALERHPAAGVLAPQVRSSRGVPEDSARRLPTPALILRKALGFSPPLDYGPTQEVLHPEWVAGMFMLFPSSAFAAVGGFDERYFLYYEDVDLCCRLRLAGYEIVQYPSVVVTHDGLRASHRNLRYMRWHLASMLRFFTSSVYRRSLLRRRRPPPAGAGRPGTGRPPTR